MQSDFASILDAVIGSLKLQLFARSAHSQLKPIKLVDKKRILFASFSFSFCFQKKLSVTFACMCSCPPLIE